MTKRMKIVIKDVAVEAELNDSPTAERIWESLPIIGRVKTWGEEIYFTVPIQAELEPDAREEVMVGELGYWTVGHAFCIFFGPTPASTDDQPRAASPVNIVGRVIGDAAVFNAVASGSCVELKPVLEPVPEAS